MVSIAEAQKRLAVQLQTSAESSQIETEREIAQLKKQLANSKGPQKAEPEDKKQQEEEHAAASSSQLAEETPAVAPGVQATFTAMTSAQRALGDYVLTAGEKRAELDLKKAKYLSGSSGASPSDIDDLIASNEARQAQLEQDLKRKSEAYSDALERDARGMPAPPPPTSGMPSYKVEAAPGETAEEKQSRLVLQGERKKAAKAAAKAAKAARPPPQLDGFFASEAPPPADCMASAEAPPREVPGLAPPTRGRDLTRSSTGGQQHMQQLLQRANPDVVTVKYEREIPGRRGITGITGAGSLPQRRSISPPSSRRPTRADGSLPRQSPRGMKPVSFEKILHRQDPVLSFHGGRSGYCSRGAPRPQTSPTVSRIHREDLAAAAAAGGRAHSSSR